MTRRITLLLALALAATAANAGTVRGRITYPNGAPYAGAAVNVVDGSQRSSTVAYTDREGMFYLHHVRAGKYVLTVKTVRTNRSLPVTVSQAEYIDVPPLAVQ